MKCTISLWVNKEGKLYTFYVRKDRTNGKFAVRKHNSKSHPFIITMMGREGNFSKIPQTEEFKPLPAAYSTAKANAFEFSVPFDDFPQPVDNRDLRSALTPLAKVIAEEKYVTPAEKLQDTVNRLGVSFLDKAPARIIDKTDDWERRKDAERQAAPVANEPSKPAPREADIPPAHIRLNDVLLILNGLMTMELNDIELFVEQIDEAGGVVKTITLPVPSQMRLKGRRIREETFG